MKLSCEYFKAEYRIALITFVFSFNFYLYTSGFTNLIVQKTCFPEGPPGTNVVCRDDAAFRETSKKFTTRLTIHDVVAGLVVMIAGPWRDITGLTLPLCILAHVGELIGCAMTFLSTLRWEFSTWATVIVDALTGFFGSRMLMNCACYSYISDHSTIEERPQRMALVVVAILGGMSLSSAASGFLLSLLNYTGLMALVFTVYLVNMVLCAWSFRDVRREYTTTLKATALDILRRISTVFRPRKNYLVTWVLLYANCALFGLMNAESSVTHSFFQKVLVLNPEQSGLLQAVRLISSLVVALAATPILMGIFKLSAFAVSIISSIPCALSSYCMAFVTSLAQAYFFYILDMPRVFFQNMLWVLLSTSIRRSEIGVYASVLSFSEALIPLIINPLYLYIFNSTIETLPGAFFIVSGSLIGTSTVLLCIASHFYEKIEDDEFERTPKIEVFEGEENKKLILP